MTSIRRLDLGRLADVSFLAIGGSFVLLRFLSVAPWDQSVDAYAYWKPVGPGGPYEGAAVGALGSYLYSPAFKMLLVPASWLPWPIFNAGWTAMNLVVLRALAGRFTLPLLLLPPVFFEIVSGNVHLLIGGAVAWGLQRRALWVLPILTKVTPGIGIGWFAVRGDWSPLAAALGLPALLAGISIVLVPAWWTDWLRVLSDEPIPANSPGWFLAVSLWLRLPLALALVGLAARTERRWVLPFATVLAMPVVWLNSFAVLVALVPLARKPKPSQEGGSAADARRPRARRRRLWGDDELRCRECADEERDDGE